MTTLQIALGLVVALLLGAWWWLRRRSAEPARGAAGGKALDRLDTVTGWPPQPTRVLSTQERLAYGTLVRALPEYMVLAQVPLSRFISVPRRNSYADWLRRVGSQSVDLIVCDMAAQVIAVVEVREPQPGERSNKRLTRIQRTLKAARVPLILWTENALPSAETARVQVLPPKPDAPALSQPMPLGPRAETKPAASPTAPSLARVNPFDEAGRDSTQDEMIEFLEPPPTFYDDLDTAPAPLKKR